MSIIDKIEKIKKQPEHIKLRYIWFFVFVSMFFIITFWIISLQAGGVQKTEDTNQAVNLFK